MFIEDGGGEMFYTLPTTAAASFFRLASVSEKRNASRDGMAAWGIPPCKTYLDLCEALPTFQLNVMGS